MVRSLPLVLLLGCGGGGESPLSIIDDLRIVALITEPASPAPDEPFLTRIETFDGGAEVESWSWWCALEGGCGTGPVPPLETPVFQVVGYVCAPLGCEGPGALDDVDSWLMDRPFETVSLARSFVAQSPSPAIRLNENPELTVTGPTEVDAGETLVLEASIADVTVEEPRVFGYAAVGSFPEAFVFLTEGPATITWVAPDAAGSVELVLVVDDGFGGQDVVRWPVEVL